MKTFERELVYETLVSQISASCDVLAWQLFTSIRAMGKNKHAAYDNADVFTALSRAQMRISGMVTVFLQAEMVSVASDDEKANYFHFNLIFFS